ncbi:MAG TPA: PIN domain-containing protein [Anaerolineales bacterium]|nr:PIN domain-containing protein [Anaerolineales bacterium]
MKIVLDLKVVMDTNVFVSGVFFSGPPYQILNAWQSGEFELVVSQEILADYRRVGVILAKERPKIDLSPILTFVLEHAKV